MAQKKSRLNLAGYDELFMDDDARNENRLPKIYEIPLSEIDEFPNHPFQVRLDEDMDQLVDSIKERGIITPVILRQKEDGRYEIVAGHRRCKASQLAGNTTVKAEIRELTRDEAIIMMVESNLQRSTILPSEKAFSYRMRLEAITDKNIKDFERVARKYGVDFALKKDRSRDTPKYLVFFKARDADALTAAFKEYTAITDQKKARPSVLQKLQKFKEQIVSLDSTKTRKKERDAR